MLSLGIAGFAQFYDLTVYIMIKRQLIIFFECA